MAVQRLTYFFLTFYQETQVNVDGVNTDALVFLTDFPFTFDEVIALPRPVRNADAVKDENGDVVGLSVEITSNGRYNDQDWFIGLGVNGQEIWNGIPRPTTDGNTILLFQNSVVSVLAAGFLPDGRGYVTISKELSSLGILDTVEILIKNAKTKTPWIYYGNIPQRQVLAQNQFGRNPSGMGGVPDSLTPSQGMGYEYFVDFNLSSQGGGGPPPFPSAIFFAGSGITSSLSQNFFMGDILDGDGRLAVRSNVTFKIFSVGQNFSIGGVEIPALQIINTGAFRTINYREMEYQTKTYIPNQLIENTNFYLAFQDAEKFNRIYTNISETVRVILSENIDFNTCKFNVYAYSGTSGSQRTLDVASLDGLVEAISSLGSSTNESEQEHNLGSLNVLMRNKIAIDAQANNTIAPNQKYAQIIFGDMNFVDSQQPLSDVSVVFETDDNEEISVAVNVVGTHILLEENEDRDLGEGVFGDSLTYIFGFKESSVYGFQFLESLGRGAELVLSEDDLYQEFDFLNAPAIINQCQTITTPLNSVDWQDRDNDGLVTYIDRITELYQNFNPSIDTGELSFFGSRGAEMRFWRRICPIGQLYSFYGQIISSTQVRNGSFVLQVNVLTENPNYTTDGDEPRFIETGVDNNNIYVYYENGAQSNTADNDGNGVFNFKGRLFFPTYWRNGIQIANGINLNDPDELSAWYRILPDTSRDLLEGVIPEDQPVVIVRTNVTGGADPTVADGQGPISNVFLNRTDTLSFYKISQFAERVEDHIISVDDDEVSEFSLSAIDQIQPVYSSPSDSSKINFQSIKFEISLPKSDDLYGEFEYEIYWQSTLGGEQHSLRRFWSAVAFANNAIPSEDEEVAALVIIPLNDKFILPTRTSWQESDATADRLLDIVFPYSQHEDDEEGIRHFFRWEEDDYSFKVFVNGTQITSGVNQELTAVQASLNPSIGQILLRDPLNSTDSVYVEFTNLTGNQSFQKTGTGVGIKLVGRPRTGAPSEGVPVFRNVQVNQSSLEVSVERVDANYYNPGGIAVNRDHFIAPAYGFAVLSGRNWDLAIDDRNSTAGGGGNLRVTGSLVSPIWFFDAFETDLSKKLVSEESPRDLVAIDRVYSNMVSTFSQPFVEILSIGFDPPPPEIIPRVSSIFDKTMQRFTIAYNVDNNIEMKYSHTGFRDRDSVYGNFDERNRSQRLQLAMYSGPEREEVLSEGNQFSTASSENPDAVLVGLRLRGGIEGALSPIQNTGVFELYASIGGTSVPFGYRQFDGTRIGLLCGFTDDNGSQKGLVQLPLTNGISSMSLEVYDGAEFGGIIDEVSGIFVDSYVVGQSPTLYKSPYGTYLAMFSQQEDNIDRITGLMSHEQTHRWSRPATRTGDQNSYEPVAILTGYINPLFLQHENSGMVHIFLYNNVEQAIDLLTIPYTAFERFNVGIDEDEEDYDSEAPETDPRGFADIIRNPEEKSWKKVFSEGRALYPIVFSATQDYSAVITKDGGVYLASVSTSGELRLLYTAASGTGEFSPNTWYPFGVDILAPEGHLGKVIDAANIYSIALSANPGGGTLELFITTVDNRLILFRVPTTLTALSGRLAEINDEVIAAMQDDVNATLPVLVVGNNPQTTEDISAGGAIAEDFPNQLPSVQWFPNGELYVVYYKDSSIKGIKSTSGGEYWREVKEI